MIIQQIFDQRKNNKLFNTSYPLAPKDWARYKRQGKLDFSDSDQISFYLHIPFCISLCPFCEYSRMLLPNSEMQHHYLKGIRGDIQNFIQSNRPVTLMGFDIGGGTPSALDDYNFAFLLEIFQEVMDKTPICIDFEPSIEGTFQTMNAYKIGKIKESNIHRISLGLQSSVERVQKSNGRKNPIFEEMADKIDEIHSMGINKVNLDLMYGLSHQTIEDIHVDIENVTQLSPEQVTLYEIRTNQTGQEIFVDKSQLFKFYDTWYEGLISHGYYGQYGQNTFTKKESDKGLSSYLRYRMLQGIPYKGFGLSAQSSSHTGVSYNCGKQLRSLKEILRLTSYPEENTYDLPPRERLSKYLAISAYYGGFSLKVANSILNTDFKTEFKQELDFCLSEKLLSLKGNELRITRKGFKYYGAVFSLFYMKVT